MFTLQTASGQASGQASERAMLRPKLRGVRGGRALQADHLHTKNNPTECHARGNDLNIPVQTFLDLPERERERKKEGEREKVRERVR